MNRIHRRTFLQALTLGGGAGIAGWLGNSQAADTANPVKLGIGASFGGKRMFPANNQWNQDISKRPVDPSSDVYIRSIGADADLHPDFARGAPDSRIGIPYVIVSGKQKPVPVSFIQDADESDPGPYPIPPNAPVEGGALSDGDRHVLVVDRDNWILYELFAAKQQDEGWQADSGAIFDLNSNKLRPAGWTSADAAGLPILPGLVRADEVFEQKAIRHALRFTCKRSRRAYVFPARHFASKKTDESLPPMGLRVRLKASFDDSRFPPECRVILTALKKYGMILADNGSNWFISGAPDPRWNNANLDQLKRVKGTDFEVVKLGTIVTG
jgi:hypothetical protein